MSIYYAGIKTERTLFLFDRVCLAKYNNLTTCTTANYNCKNTSKSIVQFIAATKI